MANSNLNYSLSNLPNIRVLLSHPHVIPAASAPPSSTSFRVPRTPSDHQSNPILLPNTPLASQSVPYQSDKVIQGPSGLHESWITVRRRQVVHREAVHLHLRDTFPPLPPPGTSSPIRHQRYAAFSASEQQTEYADKPWLRSPIPEVQIPRPKWKPSPRLDASLVPIVKRVIDAMPAHHLKKPYTGKIFKDPDAAEKRYQNYSFCKGFLVIKATGSDDLLAKKPVAIFVCKHHGDNSRN